MSPDIRAKAKYKAWWKRNEREAVQTVEATNLSRLQYKVEGCTSSKLRHPQLRYNDEYISSSEALAFFEAPHNSYCPHLHQFCLQYTQVTGCKLHIPILLQTSFFLLPKDLGENIIMVKKSNFRGPGETFYFLSGSSFGMNVVTKTWLGFLLDEAGIFVDACQVLKII